jgi:hypothetical protein
VDEVRDFGRRALRLADRAVGHQPLAFVSIAFAALVYCAFYLSAERTFPFWDTAAYQDQTYAVADAFGRSFGAGLSLIAASMSDDYNKLLTVPLVPLVWILGESRMVYIWDVVIVYFVPFLLVIAAIARRVFPERKTDAAIVAVFMTILTPLVWRNILSGYADISGAVLIGAMFLLYHRAQHGLRWRSMLACGVVAAFAILLRRHYIFPDVALYVAFLADVIITARADKWDLQRLVRALLALAGSGIVMLFVLTALAPEFVRRISNPAYGQYFAPWQASPGAVLSGMLHTLGLPMLLLAVAGIMVLPRVTVEGRGFARLIVIATFTWAVIWAFFVRQGATHYPHTLPFFMAIGLTALWLYVRMLPYRMTRFAASSAMLIVLIVGTLVAVPITPPFAALAASLPRDAAPYPSGPHVNPGYDEIVRLVYYLRSAAGPADDVVVGASSLDFNFDLLREAELTLFGPARSRLHIDYTPQFDTTAEAPPADVLTHAKFVLVADPFQHHLPADQQKKVHVLTEAFDRHWKAADDFRLLPDRFAIEPGVTLRVYERTRPASISVALDTQRRMAEYVGGAAASPEAPAAGGWAKVSSAYAASIDLNRDGTSTVTVNPTREEQEPKTILVHPEDRMDDVRISGAGRLLDPRCAGAQVVLGTQYRGPKLTPMTAFARGERAKTFDLVVRHVRGNPIYMKVDHAAASPHDVDYCSLALEHIEIKPAGSRLDERAARALRSDANPFGAAPEAAAATAAPATAAVAQAQPVTWARKSSPYPMDVAPQANGSFVFSGHPTRDGQQPETVIEFGPTSMKSVRLTGLVRFYTAQCKGSQIIAGTDYGSANPTTPVGVFTPSAAGMRFDTVVAGTEGKMVYLNFKGNPRNPQDIDFCTMRVEELRAGPA